MTAATRSKMEGDSPRSPWPHRIGVLLVITVFPLIWVGGLVTTTKAGMAVPDWPNTYGYNLFLYPLYDWFFGPWDLFVEHGHRLLATVSGAIAIVLVVICYRQRQPAWIRKYAAWLLALIIAQGVLGGIRVVLSNEALAMVHGCTGPLYLALAVGFCVMTSRWWHGEFPSPLSGPRRWRLLQRLAWIGLLLVYVQIVVGATVRHVPVDWQPTAFVHTVYLHVALAGLLLMATLAQGLLVCRWTAWREGLWSPILWAVVLILMQWGLGLTTWVEKYGFPLWFADWSWVQSHLIAHHGFWQTTIITAHQATGSLILAFWTVQALRATRSRWVHADSFRATSL